MAMNLKQIKEILSADPRGYDENLVKDLLQNDPAEIIAYFIAITRRHLDRLQIHNIVPTSATPISLRDSTYVGYLWTAFVLHGIPRQALEIRGEHQNFYPSIQQKQAFFWGIFGGGKSWTKDSLYMREFADHFNPDTMLTSKFAINYLESKVKKIDEEIKTQEKSVQIAEVEGMMRGLETQCDEFSQKFSRVQQQGPSPTAGSSTLSKEEREAKLADFRKNIGMMQSRSANWHEKRNQASYKSDEIGASSASFNR